MMKTNLWNETRKKTGQTIDYIRNMPVLNEWGSDQTRHFLNVLDETLELVNPNDMLERIGFNPTGRDKLYDEVNRMK